MEECRKKDIRILTIGDSAYPDRLRAIADPPVVLYVRGRWPDLDLTPAIAVVGTRKATAYGQKTAEELGRTLAEAGFVTVSGMALGNDGAAHRGALRAGGLTVAVLAGGVDICYPPEHRGLMSDILFSGAVVSENPPGTHSEGYLYRSKNRIVSGLSVASVIVEAPDWRSGALITARHALDQGRDVYAVPAALDAPQSAACNELIEKGEAALLRSPRSLVRTYSGLLHRPAAFDKPAQPPSAAPVSRPAWREEKRPAKKTEPPKAARPSAPPVRTEGLRDDENAIVSLVRQGVSNPAELIERSGLPAARVMSLITMLELNGVLRREKGMLTAL